MKNKFSYVLGCLLVSASLTAATVEKRTLNNGNLILEDIPEIPQQLVDDLNRYQNVRSASFNGWSETGNGLYIKTRFGDVSQLHRVLKPGGARHQLTFFQEPVGQVAIRPDSQSLAFTMDAGGSEFSQVFLMDLDSGKYRMITDGESRNGALRWNDDGSKLAYQSTQRNGRSNDIWIADVDSDEKVRHKMVVQAEDGSWWGPSAFSEGGDKLLVQQYVSANQSMVHVKELSSDSLSRVAGNSEKKSRNFALDFTADGESIFILTDRYSDFNQLVVKELASGNETVITKDILWDVNNFILNDAKSMAAFTTNEDGMSKLYLLDTDSLDYVAVDDFPVGVAGSLAFNKNGDKLALQLNTAKTPTDVFVLDIQSDLKSGKLERWTFSEVGGLNTDKFVEPELVHYPTFDQVNGEPRKIPAFVYKPKADGPHPVIISIHGGPESQYRPNFSSTVQLWIEEVGAAVIAPNVRGSAGYGKEYVALDNGFKREDSVKDIGALLDWIKTQPDLDEDRVVVIGGSYGGYMVLASAVHYSDRLKGAVDIVGISNFVTFLKNTQDYRRDLRRVEYGDERDPAMRKHLEEISPNNHVDKIKVPMFIVQGENDPRVPVTEATQMVAALREAGDKVWYMNALNEGHGYRKKENRDVYQQAVVMFFKKHLLP
ncbi:S9 family peptidase [Kangiella sediminilitoris]|uniref:Prolyl oligopeptidase family protein n=1 Tax=Kangiella sediminilitoris TaxID=1144748 RepID=A0A1B3B7N6_9GAMM|nr:S9 family peptidase [Kangiella sediminilitoris]AOE48796.1 prolyl oligopeptidase family protein [Kangiella sediminilitoris]